MVRDQPLRRGPSGCMADGLFKVLPRLVLVPVLQPDHASDVMEVGVVRELGQVERPGPHEMPVAVPHPRHHGCHPGHRRPGGRRGHRGRAGVADPGAVQDHHPVVNGTAAPRYEQSGLDPVHESSSPHNRQAKRLCRKIGDRREAGAADIDGDYLDGSPAVRSMMESPARTLIRRPRSGRSCGISHRQYLRVCCRGSGSCAIQGHTTVRQRRAGPRAARAHPHPRPRRHGPG